LAWTALRSSCGSIALFAGGDVAEISLLERFANQTGGKKEEPYVVRIWLFRDYCLLRMHLSLEISGLRTISFRTGVANLRWTPSVGQKIVRS
jgi:hypothetical protein